MDKPIFYNPDICKTLSLSPEESAHCVKVLRKQVNDEIIIADGKGYFYDAEITEAHYKKCIVELKSQKFVPKSWNFNLHVAFAPTKNMDRIEWFIEKAVEIGIDRFTPLLCENSERRIFKTERIQKIIISAFKQSCKSFMPVLDELTPFKKFLQEKQNCQKFIAHCREGKKLNFKDDYTQGNDVLILIGPEGDFSKDEIGEALQIDYKPISLCRSRLRTETAALFATNYLQILNF